MCSIVVTTLMLQSQGHVFEPYDKSLKQSRYERVEWIQHTGAVYTAVVSIYHNLPRRQTHPALAMNKTMPRITTLRLSIGPAADCCLVYTESQTRYFSRRAYGKMLTLQSHKDAAVAMAAAVKGLQVTEDLLHQVLGASLLLAGALDAKPAPDVVHLAETDTLL